jgi:4-hydroxybenzoyl-CoA reductase subunit beta
MMRLPRFQYFAPRAVDEAAAILADWGAEAAVVAGGTDLFPNMKRRQQTPRRVIGLRGVAALGAREGDAARGITLGAMTSLTRVEHDRELAAAWPALTAAAASISTPPLRNMGTLGGNLCIDTRCNYWSQNYEWRKAIDFCLKKDGDTCWVAPGSPRCWAVSSSDTAPVLCAIGAEVSLTSRAGGTRRIPVAELFADDGIKYLAKRDDEILCAIHLPAQDGRTRAVYRKVRRRGSFDFPVLGVAAALRFGADGRTVESARLVLGAVGSHPHDARDAAAKLVGRAPFDGDEDALREAVELAARVAKPLDNTDFELGWRKEMARHEIAAALRSLRARS